MTMLCTTAVVYSTSLPPVLPPHSIHSYSTNTAAAAAAAPDRSVGVHVVRRERLDGDGKSLALSRVAGRRVPVSRAHHHGSHVAQVFRFEGHFLGKGERYVLAAVCEYCCGRVIQFDSAVRVPQLQSHGHSMQLVYKDSTLLNRVFV